MHDIIIIGGGPSGMMAAISAKMTHPELDVSILERNQVLGMKMKLTGGGRCNVTANMSVDEIIEYIPKNGKFLYSALNQFGPQDIIKFFEKHQCPLKMEDHMRMFPKSDKAQDIVDTLVKKINALGIKVYYETFVEDIDIEKKQVKTSQKRFNYQHLIIATGGITLPKSGSDGTGHQLSKTIGHHITDLVPAEVPLVSNDAVIQDKALQGLSFKDVELKIYEGSKLRKTIKHDLLITHFGLSGPAALRGSFYVLNLLSKYEGSPVKVVVDFIPEITIQTLESLSEEKSEELVKEHGMPKRFIDYLKDKNLEIKALKNFEFSVYTTRGWSQAFVTNGGVSVKEVDPKTLRSKINDSISFCGEVLDVNAFTGGFNITLSFATGYVAGSSILL